MTSNSNNFLVKVECGPNSKENLAGGADSKTPLEGVTAQGGVQGMIKNRGGWRNNLILAKV